MKKRIITATVLILVLLPVAIIEVLLPVLQLLLIALVLGATYELLHMYDKEKKFPLGVKITSAVLTLLLYFSIEMSFIKSGYVYGVEGSKDIVKFFTDTLPNQIQNLLNPLIILSLIFVIYGAFMILIPDMDVNDIGKLFVSTFYVGVCAAAFTAVRLFGVRFIIYLLLITVLTDIFALVFGMKMGKHKMAPVTSPKKTWEGAIGGTATAVIVACLFANLYPLFSSAFGDKIDNFFQNVGELGEMNVFGTIVFTVFLTLAISVCSQIGDLVASKLKRKYGIKDYSNIFPGHGGILDRFDSALFAAAMFLAFMLVAMAL